MAKNLHDALDAVNETVNTAEEKVTITKVELEALKSGKSELKQLVEGLASAIQESRKPYVSPGEEENERMFQEASKRQAAAQRLQKKIDQDSCPHIMACNPLSDSWDMHNRSSFIRHRLDTGATVLMCTNCQKTIFSFEEDFNKYASLRTGNRPSAAGERFFADPIAVQRAGR